MKDQEYKLSHRLGVLCGYTDREERSKTPIVFTQLHSETEKMRGISQMATMTSQLSLHDFILLAGLAFIHCHS